MIEDVARLRLTVDSTGLNEAQTKINSLGKSGKSASGSLRGLANASTATKLAMGGLALGVTAVGATIVKTTKKWLEFNVAMKEVETIAGATGSQMKALRLDALKVAQSIGVDATEAAQGFYQALSAGIDAKEVKGFVEVAAQLGKGGLADIGSSTDLLTTALNAYGKSTSEARKVSDQLFRTVKLGKTNIPQLASSLARVAPVAATAGVELEELLGIVASTTKQGVKTAESMTQIKAAIVALLNPSETMAGIFDQLGVSSGRQLIAQEGLAGALEKVRIASGGNDKVLNQSLKSIEAYSLSATITKDKLQDTADAIKEIGDASGDTAKASAIAGDTLGTSFSKLGNSLLILAENFNQATGASEGLSGAIADVADSLADPDLLSGFAELYKRLATKGLRGTVFSYVKEEIGFLKTEVGLSIDQQKSYDEAIKKSAVIRASALGDVAVLSQKILDTEKEIAKQKSLLANSTDKATIDVANAKLESLKNQAIYQDRIYNTSTLRQKIDIDIAKRTEQIAREYRSQSISLKQFSEKLKEIKRESKEINERLEKTGLIFASAIKAITVENNKLLKAGEEANELATTQNLLQELYNEEIGDSVKILQDKLDLFDKLAENNTVLTKEQTMLLEIYKKQLKVLQDQTKESAKSQSTLDFESLKQRYQTKDERAKIEYDKDLEIIKQSGASLEQKAKLFDKAYGRYVEAIAVKGVAEPEEQIPKAVDLQTGINQSASGLAFDYIADDPYEAEILRLKEAEREKLEIIRESTNLTYQEQQDIIKRIQLQTAQDIKKVEEAQFQERLNIASDFFGNLSATAQVFGEKGARAAKAFAIAQATVDTYASAVSAYKAMAGIPVVGPVLGAVAAAGAIASGLAQIQAIKATKYQQGGIVGGSSYGGDQINAKLNSGEMVLNQTQQRNLFSMANNPIGGNSKRASVTIINQTGSEIKGEVQEDSSGDIQIYIEKAVKQTKDELTSEASYGGGTFLPALEKSFGLARR
jgi:TP901 family phage tail tape measure protein